METAWKLYLSRALTAWGDRLWAFGLGLLVFRLYPQNLTLVAAFGLVRSFVSIALGASVGNWIDGVQRLRAARAFVLVKNLFVAANCVIFAAYYQWQPQLVAAGGDWVRLLVAVVTILLALVSDLAAAGSRIVVEKDWTVVIAAGSEDSLASLNSVFRSLDLVCANVTPVLAGLLFSYTSYSATAAVIAGWSVAAVVAESALLTSIYRQYPGLASKPVEAGAAARGLVASVTASWRGWGCYWRHRVRGAGLGLALLYMTVLGFDSITWSYALLQCVPESVLGLLVSAAALVGVAGSLLYPRLRVWLGSTERAGGAGMLALVAPLTLCLASVWCPGSPFSPGQLTNTTANTTVASRCEAEDTRPDLTSVTVLLTGIIAARAGVWLADLAVTQILQENVEAGKRGVINGVQTSICSGFDLVKFSLVLIMPQENMFGLLVILSYLFICAGALCYFSYVAREPPPPSNSSSARYHQAAQTEHAQSEKVSLRTID